MYKGKIYRFYSTIQPGGKFYAQLKYLKIIKIEFIAIHLYIFLIISQFFNFSYQHSQPSKTSKEIQLQIVIKINKTILNLINFF